MLSCHGPDYYLPGRDLPGRETLGEKKLEPFLKSSADIHTHQCNHKLYKNFMK